ncbi:PepSY-associated TM helix domain-containing protein [Porifericola rhodea]|uniref:PepSY-associated TM helix domain-containing protein n=1 Tax=Porifericola rhodea TaxID=930972 RepID=UPI00266608BE|nr:PepSY-associated TM helix domain-containing protein [Porifericola rhodea]WKN30179.1 PepSY-associated TM helix domain-containing protein [Porifericola rhodea]
MLSKDQLFKLHSWVGIKLSILLFVVCFSGTLAVLSHEMDWLFNPDVRVSPADTYASWNTIAENVKQEFPEGKISYWQRANEPYMADLIYVMQDNDLKYVFANPHTGEVQGYADITIARFLRDLHYYLFIPFQIGHFTVLFFGFILTISLLTGIFYYNDWYKELFVLKSGKGSRVFYSSLHKLVGAWSIPFMFIISLTAIWYFVERADLPKVSSYLDEERPTIEITEGQQLPNLDYDAYVAIAEEAIAGLKVKSILSPQKPDEPVYLTGTSDVPLVRYRANRVYINPHNQELLKVQKATEINSITWINDIADPIHFGYWGGLLTKLIWFVFGLALSSLVLTGPWLYLKKRRKKDRLQRERRLAHG